MRAYRHIIVLGVVLGATGLASAQTSTTTTTTTTTEQQAPLVLTPQQRTTIYRTVRPPRSVTTTAVAPAQTEVRVGSTVPSSVELHTLPESVYVTAPALKRYKYFYVNDELVLVDLDTSKVVDIITK
jgi:hypothetical protein